MNATLQPAHSAGTYFFELTQKLRREPRGARFTRTGRSSRLVTQTLSPVNSLPEIAVSLIQLLPDDDEPCCSVWGSLVAAGDTVMAYVPIGVSIALRKYLFPICAKLSPARPV